MDFYKFLSNVYFWNIAMPYDISLIYTEFYVFLLYYRMHLVHILTSFDVLKSSYNFCYASYLKK